MDPGLIGNGSGAKIVDYLRSHGANAVPGDGLEIGAFTGAMTRRLAEFAAEAGKTLHTVDPFDTGVDPEMQAYYDNHLGGRSQRELFDENTQGLDNLVIHEACSRFIFAHGLWPARIAFAWAFVDGSHDVDDVIEDFRDCWDQLTYGGVMVFHDYQHDLPEVTRALDRCLDNLKYNGLMELHHIEVLKEMVCLAVWKR